MVLINLKEMGNNYTKIVQDNLKRLYGNLPENLAKALPSKRDGNSFLFDVIFESSICFDSTEGAF